MNILIIGGGIGGLTLALKLHAAGMNCSIRICEAVAEAKPLGVGINMLPHAMRELCGLGLEDALRKVGVEAREFAYFTHHGQFILSEPCGKNAGYDFPHFSIHRADLHKVLFDAVVERLGADVISMGHRCTGFEQDADSVTAHFADPSGNPLPSQNADIAIACDGLHSAMRKQLYPSEGAPVFHGINMWRGVTKAKPFLTGASITRIGGLFMTGKLLFYPVRNNIDDEGNQLINWVVELFSDKYEPADWTRPGDINEVLPQFENWRFEWLDAPAILRNGEFTLKYPMVDRDPVSQWTFGRVTLLGDAAHPMYPRGGNGGAQSILDAEALTRHLLAATDPRQALQAYAAERIPVTREIVLQNRTAPPDLIIDTVEKKSNGQRFERLQDVISEAELHAISKNYQRVAGWDKETVSAKGR